MRCHCTTKSDRVNKVDCELLLFDCDLLDSKCVIPCPNVDNDVKHPKDVSFMKECDLFLLR